MQAIKQLKSFLKDILIECAALLLADNHLSVKIETAKPIKYTYF